MGTKQKHQADDGAAGAAGGGDIRGVQLAGSHGCKHAVGGCDDGDEAGGADDGGARAGPSRRRAEAISGEFNLQEVANTLWVFATMGTKPGKQMMGQLERRADVISGKFNLKVVENTL